MSYSPHVSLFLWQNGKRIILRDVLGGSSLTDYGAEIATGPAYLVIQIDAQIEQRPVLVRSIRPAVEGSEISFQYL